MKFTHLPKLWAAKLKDPSFVPTANDLLYLYTNSLSQDWPKVTMDVCEYGASKLLDMVPQGLQAIDKGKGVPRNKTDGSSWLAAQMHSNATYLSAAEINWANHIHPEVVVSRLMQFNLMYGVCLYDNRSIGATLLSGPQEMDITPYSTELETVVPSLPGIHREAIKRQMGFCRFHRECPCSQCNNPYQPAKLTPKHFKSGRGQCSECLENQLLFVDAKKYGRKDLVGLAKRARKNQWFINNIKVNAKPEKEKSSRKFSIDDHISYVMHQQNAQAIPGQVWNVGNWNVPDHQPAIPDYPLPAVNVADYGGVNDHGDWDGGTHGGDDPGNS